MLGGFGADDGLVVASAFKGSDGGFGAATTAVVESNGLGFDFGAAISLLTRTDAGTMDVSSGVC